MGEAQSFLSFKGVIFMEEPMVDLARRLSQQFKEFLEACREAGDVTVDDVLKRLEELKKET